MNFLKTSFLTAISTIIRLMSGLVINKIVAIYVGPSGIALLGQFLNIFGIITNLGNGAINTGVTKYVAEYNENLNKRNQVISASIIIIICFSLITGFFVFLFSERISDIVLQSDKYRNIFKLLGVTLVFISLNTFFLALLNGLKQIKQFVLVNIISSFVALILSSTLTIKFKLFGAFSATILAQVIILLVSLVAITKLKDFKYKFKFSVNTNIYRRMFAFSLMTIVSIISVSLTQILIRDYIIDEFSIRKAGIWQGIWKVSEMYLMVLTTAFSTYYLPKLSELKSRIELRNEIMSGYKIIIPFVISSTLLVYLCRDFIIWLLFTPEFYEMRSLFFYQLLGDVFKMISWTLAFLMIAKAMTKSFIITELVFSLSFYLLTIILTKTNGLIGVTQAYALNYLLYLLLMIYMFSEVLIGKKNCLINKNKKMEGDYE
ncbi:O-antigen translocase [Fictibacillus halophilus]|uniref:O-antigen translocase n=1 Tax=Fictibacillus halophilus TaxID=1610490 RepID=UPI00363EF837